MSNLKQGIQKVKKIDYLPLIFAYAVIIIFFSVCSPYFLSFTNFMSIILYASIVGILSLTTCLVLAAGQIHCAGELRDGNYDARRQQCMGGYGSVHADFCPDGRV